MTVIGINRKLHNSRYRHNSMGGPTFLQERIAYYNACKISSGQIGNKRQFLKTEVNSC